MISLLRHGRARGQVGGGGGGGSGSFANEPAGFTLIEDFDASQFPVWPAVNPPFWHDDTGATAETVSMVVDPTAPMPSGFSDNKYLTMLFDTSLSAGSAPASILRYFQTGEFYRKVFVGWWLRHEIGWDNNPPPISNKSGVKLMWLNADTADVQFYWGHDGDTMIFNANQQRSGSPLTGVDRHMTATMNSAASLLQSRIGSWVKYELIAGMSSADGVPDGTLDVWIDDVQVMHFTDVAFNGPDSGPRVWSSFKWNPTFGGGGSPPQHDQYQSISHIRLSGSN